MKLNCPNCGAPIDKETNKCPYCNTSYFDFSNVDIDNEEPFYLRIKKGDIYIVSLVKAKNTNITFTKESVTFYGYGDKKLGNVTTSSSVEIDIEFQSVLDKNETLFQISKNI